MIFALIVWQFDNVPERLFFFKKVIRRLQKHDKFLSINGNYARIKFNYNNTDYHTFTQIIKLKYHTLTQIKKISHVHTNNKTKYHTFS